MIATTVSLQASTSNATMAQIPTSFLFVVNELPVNNNAYDGGIEPRANEYGYWLPPIYSAGFAPQIPGRMYRWSNGNINDVSLNGYQWHNGQGWYTSYQHISTPLTPYATTSLFWCNDWTQFLMLESDATAEDIETAEPPNHRWYPLSFLNVGRVSRVATAMEDQHLAGNHAWWIERLGLESYRSIQRANRLSVDGLGGRIATIFALVAFSCPNATDLHTILTSHEGWRRGLRNYNAAHGRQHERGVVVSIYLDPQNERGSTMHTLYNLEWNETPILR
ncbi:hypothetical protein ACMFMG_001616 [Clarireedia jacksonii]